jgi:spoIIIJ-associated protein
MEWVEVEGKTVEIATKAGLEELGIESVDEAEVEVLKEPERGFLGFGGSMALVRIKPKPKKKRRRRSGRGRGRGGGGERGSGSDKRGRNREQTDSGREKSRSGGDQRGGDGRRGGRDGTPRREGGRSDQKPEGRGGRGDGGGQGRKGGRKPREAQPPSAGERDNGGRDRDRGSQRKGEPAMSEETTPIDVEAQSEIINEFLVGLLDAFGLEGDVHVRVEDGIVHADVTGEQTEALVGNRGVILQSILELCRTVVQRKSHSSARIRLDVAGYAERRREALRIYASRLAEQVLEDGQEAMLEPMNPADRKVVHDAISDIENVRTYSEGEEPNRSVVVSLAPGVEPKGSADQETGESGDDDAGRNPMRRPVRRPLRPNRRNRTRAVTRRLTMLQPKTRGTTRTKPIRMTKPDPRRRRTPNRPRSPACFT